MAAVLGVLAAACGIAHSAEPTTPQAQALYVGYYQEDPLNNPEDPTMGTVYLNLPTQGGAFAGNMFFTYVGCQSSNVGTISGTKAAEGLQGTWAGSTDGTEQHGEFAGRRVPGKDAYAGTYNVAGGKQHIVVNDCIQYYVAAKGTFELFAAGKSEPASFAIAVHGTTVSWLPPTDAIMTLVSVIDPELARGGRANATVWQTLVMRNQHAADLRGARLLSGHHYLASVGAVDQSFKRISFGSTEFAVP